MKGKIYQINIKPETPGERGLPKRPVDVVRVARQGLEADFNRFRHEERQDDPNKAILILCLETILKLNDENWPVRPGDVGENFTLQGIPYHHLDVGQLYRMGPVEIQITEICHPCGNLKFLPYIGQNKINDFVRTLVGRRGWYARVLKEGRVEKGCEIEEVVSA